MERNNFKRIHNSYYYNGVNFFYKNKDNKILKSNIYQPQHHGAFTVLWDLQLFFSCLNCTM